MTRTSPSRRLRTCLWHCAIAATALLVSGASGAEPRPAPAPAGMRLAADFEPVAAVWLGFDRGHAEFTAALVAALAPHVKLKMLVADDTVIDDARAMLDDMGVATDAIDFLVEPLAPYFMRDAAVFTTDDRGALGVVDFKWTGHGLPVWCKQRHAADTEAQADCVASVDSQRDALAGAVAKLADARVIASTLALEGGAIESNGQGLIIVCEAVVMQRNPGLSRSQLERELLRIPGVRKVVWLPAGLAEDPHIRSTIVGPYVGWGTGGHTDEFVRFADARTVLLAWVDAAEAAVHPVARLNRQRLQRNFELLSRATDQDGRPLRIVKVPMPSLNTRAVILSDDADPKRSEQWSAETFPAHERRRQGDEVIQVAPSSYLNFVVANGVVVLPDYLPAGTPKFRQDRVQTLFEHVFPGRRIEFVAALAANWYGGGPHCATWSEPVSGR